MSGFTKRIKGSVEIEHFSTASLIKITFSHKEQKNQFGDMETIVTEQWFSYSEFSDLYEAINSTGDWSHD